MDRKLAHLLLLAACWGPSFLFIRVVVHEVPPVTMVAGRMVAATTLLYALLRLRGGRLPRERKTWLHFGVLAIVGVVFPFVLVGWGEQYVDSAIASILNGTVPIFTLVLAHFWTDDDRMTGRSVVGVLLGMAGVVLLIAPAIDEGASFGVLGFFACVLSAAFYGFSGVYARKFLRGLPPLAAPTMQFLLASVMLVPLSLAIDQPWTIAAPSAAAWGAWAGLTFVGTVAAFVIYFRLLEFATASYISMVTYLVPLLGVVLGVVVLGERLRWNAYAGCALILVGVVAVNGLPRRKKPDASDATDATETESREPA